MKSFLRPTDGMAMAVFVAMSLAAATLTELTADRRYLVFGISVAGLLMIISALSRRFSIHPALIHLWQGLALAGAVVGLGVNAAPGPGNPLDQVWQSTLEGILHIQTQTAPMPPHAGAAMLFVLLIGLVTIIADMLVLTLATPAWVAAPLLTLYLIPALALRWPAHWWSYVLLGVAYLVVLAADTSRDLSGWTRNLRKDDAGRESTAAGVWGMATLIGAPVVALALVAGNLLPTFGTLDLTSRRPRGMGPIQMQDPTIELNRNLAQQSDRVALTYTSDDPEGQYLRLASLSVMERDSWKLTGVQLRDGELSAPPGLRASGVVSTTQIQVGDFGSQYLPAPYAPQSFDAAGQWAHDPVTMMILSTAQDNADATRDLRYTVTSVGTDPDPATFNNARVGVPPDADLTATVPQDVPKEIIDLTAKVTRSAPTPVLKAAAIQAFLRDPQTFTYSTQAPAGDGFEVIRNFLLDERAGYCIHFASSMALMARISGIPSRMAVGFLPGTKKGGRWEVRGKEMHSWPELYFENFGWVRFEPTAGVAPAPAWTLVQGSNPSATSSTGPSASPSVSTSTTPSPSQASSSGPTETQTTAQVQVLDDQGDRAVLSRRVATGLGIGVGMLTLLLTPLLIRTLVRRRRVGAAGPAADQVEGLWAEVRDSLRDLGIHWPDGSPRQKAAAIGAGFSEPAQQGLERLAMAVERARYSRGLSEVPVQLRKDVRYVAAEAGTRAGLGTRLRSLFLPTSLFVNLGRGIRRRSR